MRSASAAQPSGPTASATLPLRSTPASPATSGACWDARSTCTASSCALQVARFGDGHRDVAVAMELFLESLRIRRAALGDDHRGVAFVLYNIALVHQQRGCYAEAIES